LLSGILYTKLHAIIPDNYLKMLVNIPKNGNIAHLTSEKQLYAPHFATFFRLMSKDMAASALE